MLTPGIAGGVTMLIRSEEHTSELQSPCNLVCRLLLEKKKYLSVSLLSISLYIYPFLYYLSFYLSIYVSSYPFISLSLSLSVYLSLYSLYHSYSLSIYISTFVALLFFAILFLF